MIDMILFDLPIEGDTVAKFILALEKFKKSTNPLQIYIKSYGGYHSDAEACQRAIESFAELKEIELIAYGQLSSAAFFMFFRTCNVKHTVLDSAFSEIHTWSREYSIRDLERKPRYEVDEFQIQKANRANKELMRWMVHGCRLKKSEIRDIFDNSRTVFLDAERLQEIAERIDRIQGNKTIDDCIEKIGKNLTGIALAGERCRKNKQSNEDIK